MPWKIDLAKLWSYFKRGHGLVAFLFSIANFITIQYYLVVSKIPLLKGLGLPEFALLVAIAYTPVAILLGRIDYKRFSARTDSYLMARVNPFFKDLARALTYIAQGENQKAIETMKKWIE